MDSAGSKPVAAPFHVLATDDGVHNSVQWASVTTDIIVQPKADASLEARAQINNLKYKIGELLFGVFEECKAATSPTDVIMISQHAAREISDLAQNTPWAMQFAATPIRTAMEEVIRRNLITSVEIALKTE
jgi:hypothetical protein